MAVEIKVETKEGEGAEFKEGEFTEFMIILPYH